MSTKNHFPGYNKLLLLQISNNYAQGWPDLNHDLNQAIKVTKSDFFDFFDF